MSIGSTPTTDLYLPEFHIHGFTKVFKRISKDLQQQVNDESLWLESRRGNELVKKICPLNLAPIVPHGGERIREIFLMVVFTTTSCKMRVAEARLQQMPQKSESPSGVSGFRRYRGGCHQSPRVQSMIREGR